MTVLAGKILRRFASGCNGETKKAVNFKGIFSALAVPFNEAGEIDYKKFECNIIKYEKAVPSVQGYAVGGSNGEVNTLSPSERVSLIAKVRKLVAPNKVIIGGASAESTPHVIEMSKEMSKAGADAILVLCPFYFRKKMTNEVLRWHYERVADESPVPVVLYNNPVVSNIDMALSTIVTLAQHENIQAVKDHDIRKLTYITMLTKNVKFDALVASAGYLLPALQLGLSGAMIGLTNVLCKDVCELYKLVRENKLSEAVELQKRIIPTDILLLSELGPPGIKAAMDIMGYEGGFCRAPLQPVSKETSERITQTLKQYKLL